MLKLIYCIWKKCLNLVLMIEAQEINESESFFILFHLRWCVELWILWIPPGPSNWLDRFPKPTAFGTGTVIEFWIQYYIFIYWYAGWLIFCMKCEICRHYGVANEANFAHSSIILFSLSVFLRFRCHQTHNTQMGFMHGHHILGNFFFFGWKNIFQTIW